MRFAWRTIPVLLALGVCGCASRGNVELLEARLRGQQDRLATMRSRLQSVQSELAASRRETEALRAQLAEGDQPALFAEQAGVLYRATGLRFQSLLTGGFDADGKGGDDELNVVLYPHDADGEPLKLPGRLEFELLDLTRPEGKRRLGRWSFDAAESRKHWQQGVLGTGFRFRLPWQTVPESRALLVHGRLITADGRRFAATQEIRVDPPRPRIAKETASGRREAAGD